MRVTSSVKAVFYHSSHEVVKATVSCRLSWTDSRPLSIRIDFNTRWQDRVTWELSRDLLHKGVTGKWGPVGDGDVRVQLLALLDCLSVELESPYGYAEFLFKSNDIREFLDETLKAVPFGAETVKIPNRIPSYMLAEEW